MLSSANGLTAEPPKKNKQGHTHLFPRCFFAQQKHLGTTHMLHGTGIFTCIWPMYIPRDPITFWEWEHGTQILCVSMLVIGQPLLISWEYDGGFLGYGFHVGKHTIPMDPSWAWKVNCLKSRRCRLLREVFSALLLPPWFAGAFWIGLDGSRGKEVVSACWEHGVLTEEGWEIYTKKKHLKKTWFEEC